MTAIPLTEPSLLNAKRALRQCFVEEKSAHLTEALAAACGFASHAALLAAVRQMNADDPDYVLLRDDAFIRRMNELIEMPMEDDPGLFDRLSYPSKDGVIETWSPNSEDGPYTSLRDRAWRNMMVAAINTGIERRLFTIRAGDNRWPGSDTPNRGEIHVFEFDIEGIPAIASVSDAGWDELAIHIALWPTPEGKRWVRTSNGGFLAGEAFAMGWMERKDGAWLQFNGKPVFNCRKHRLRRVADVKVETNAYSDRGNFKM